MHLHSAEATNSGRSQIDHSRHPLGSDLDRLKLDILKLSNDTSGTETPLAEFDRDSTVHGSEDDADVKSPPAGTLNRRKLQSLPQLFEHAVNSYSSKTAVICGDHVVTYAELDDLVNSLARGLLQRRVQPGDIVGVAMPRSVELVAALLAVSKLCAAYIPIDPAFPTERIRQMTDDASPKLLVISSAESLSFIPDPSIPTATITELLQRVDATTANPSIHSDTQVQIIPSTTENPDPISIPFAPPLYSRITSSVPSPESLAYIIYTSGSTGLPKGVEISHAGLSNLLLSMLSTPGFSSSDTLLAVTTISFDMAMPELFVPLISGGTVVVARQEEVRDAAALRRLVKKQGVTVVQGTPVLWGMLMEYLGSVGPGADKVEDRVVGVTVGDGERGLNLKQIWCGGEALSKDLASRLLRHADAVWNLYGPTEVTVYAAMWKVREGEKEIRVGYPVGGCMLYVVDTEGGALGQVKPGEVGELFVGGKGVAKGYRNRQELTQQKFLRNPWHGGSMYRTGDLARVDVVTGEVSVLGRMDGQVKIRGHRIEVGDVESAILQHEEVSGAVVVARDERLVAYCVRKRAAPEGQGVDRPALANLLRPLLAQRLPAYMVPAFFVELEAFPTTLNGKIDRKAFPDPATSLPSPASVMTVTELEKRILQIWSSALGHSRIGVRDNFFDIGGDSLRVVRVQKELENLLGRPVSVATLFEYYTVKALAKHLSGPAVINDDHSTSFNALNTEREDIAIVSMACRLPGGSSTPEAFWALLARGDDAITDVPPDRWEAKLPNATASYPRCGGFLSSIHSFDASFFSITPREAHTLDPSHYMMLETVHEAFERAGYTSPGIRGSETGVYIGVSNIPAFQNPPDTAAPGRSSSPAEDNGGYAMTGSAPSTLSGRISHHFDLSGPTMTIDTACSSSLVATHLACTSLQNGECGLAVVGGVSLMLNPGLQAEFTRLGGASPDSRCRSFSEDSNGTGFSEGCVVVLLKRASDALRDGDVVHAVIRGSAVNHDGRSAGLTVPSQPAQARLVRTALARARMAPGDVDYIEAHGTGTRLGDPIEAAALGEVFGKDRERKDTLWVGSVKSNLGHTQAAAGLAGLMKVVLALKNGVLPATIHVSKPTGTVDWAGTRMMPVTERRAWPRRNVRTRRAGVSAFGIGGTNAHVVVEEGPSMQHQEEGSMFKRGTKLKTPLPFLLSADTDAALQLQANNLHTYLATDQGAELDLDDVAYSLATTRNHYRKRLVVHAKDRTGLLEKLSLISATPTLPAGPEPPKLAMLFTGQGSQYPSMGKGLCEAYPVFDKAIREIAAELDRFLAVPLLEVMWAASGSDAASLLDRTDYAQPALFALETALWRLWQSWGVAPGYLVGHSLGEVVAAHAAGILELSDACRLVAARGRLMQAQAGDYSMVSIEAGGAEVAEAVERLRCDGEIEIALYNTPTQTVISGTAKAVESVRAYFSQQDCKTKTVLVGHAFHSRYMDNMLVEFRAVVDTIRFHPSRICIISSLDGMVDEQSRMHHAEYWVRQVRQPVRFIETIQTLARFEVDSFIEIGPHPVLSGMGAGCLADDQGKREVNWLPSLSRGRDGVSTLLLSLSRLHTQHLDINWHAYFTSYGCRRVQLPTYPFQRTFHQVVPKHAVGVAEGRPIVTSTPIQGTESLEFGITWEPAVVNSVHPVGAWGVISRSGSAWATDVKAILSRAGICLVEVDSLGGSEELDRIICLWDENHEDISATQTLVAEPLAQLQMAAKMQLKQPLIWITHHAIGTDGASDDQGMILGPGSLLWGLMRTARSENPDLRLRLVDLGQDVAPNAILSALSVDGEPECAARLDRVLFPRMQRVSVPYRVPEKPLVRPDGAVLITGGLGYLGAHVARWLATKHGVRDLVLTSRHGMETPGAKELVDELSAAEIVVTVVASDIADATSVASIIASFTSDRPLRGIVHAAGVSDSGVLSSLTPLRCEKTIAPKACGAWLLHEATKDSDLDFFVMFSSVSGVMGMPGLANYAAANCFLDALAHLRRAQGLAATSVAYGTWAGDGGMAARLGDGARSHLAQFGLDSMLPEVGLSLMERAVVSNRPLTIAAGLDLDRLREFCRAQGDSIPRLLQSLLPEDSPASHLRSGRPSLRELLGQSRTTEHASIMLNLVREVVARDLGFTHHLDVDVDRPLRDVGIDSLTAVQIRNHLASLTGLTLSVNIAFLHANLRALSAALLTQFQTETSPTQALDRLDIDALCNGSLDEAITFDDHQSAAVKPRSVFLTGATGFVGAFILHALLQRGITTHCLVRAADAPKALQRILAALDSYSLPVPTSLRPLIIPVPGDVSRPLFGLSPAAFSQLSKQIDAICHAAGLVDWMRPLSEYIGPNVVSTHEILRLASPASHLDAATTSNSSRKKIPIHLISTISTLPFHAGRPSSDSDPEHGYGTSKYLAERLVSSARWRGADATVYRLPYVTASTRTGAFRQDRGDFLHNLVVGGLQMGSFPLISASADMAIVLPVDYLADVVAGILLGDHGERAGRDWDFRHGRTVACNDFFAMVGRIGSDPASVLESPGRNGRAATIEMVGFREWKQRALDFAAKHPRSHLARISAVLDGFNDDTAASMFQGERVGRHVFGGDLCPAPRLDEEWARRYLGRIVRLPVESTSG
ncbi:hypothetical protein QBC42DRAFT_311162 [Cladorrhinum samala]|uniref:Polyketide synthase n=1 Tax=Cladorrhinum samala TaxID=585594 RepID=A0AAV9HFP3_9PEZI|nr:hypothetical protein QBC42DRAFT_311162 [Cladorrhinum samala]